MNHQVDSSMLVCNKLFKKLSVCITAKFYVHPFYWSLKVGADGANSLVRKKLMCGNTYHAKEYEQMGVVGTVSFAQPLADGNETAYQKFLPTGPIALLPLNATKSSLVWTLPPKTAKELVKFEPKSFARILNANLSNRRHSDLIDSAVAQINKLLPSGVYLMSLVVDWET